MDTCTEAKLFLLPRDLPMLGSVMIKLYRENYNKKKREKAPATELGMPQVLSQTFWFLLSMLWMLANSPFQHDVR